MLATVGFLTMSCLAPANLLHEGGCKRLITGLQLALVSLSPSLPLPAAKYESFIKRNDSTRPLNATPAKSPITSRCHYQSSGGKAVGGNGKHPSFCESNSAPYWSLAVSGRQMSSSSHIPWFCQPQTAVAPSKLDKVANILTASSLPAICAEPCSLQP